MPLRSKRANERQSLGEFALALHDVDGDVGLAVDAGGEVLGGAGRDGGVALDDLRDDAAEGLDAERERGDVEQQQVLGGRAGGAAGEDLRLHGGAEGDHLVGIEFGVRLLAAGAEAEELVDQGTDCGDAGGAADEDDLVDLRRR